MKDRDSMLCRLPMAMMEKPGHSKISLSFISVISRGNANSPLHRPSISCMESINPIGPAKDNGLDLPERLIVCNRPGMPSIWSPCRCDTMIRSTFMNERVEHMSCLWDPSPQSKRVISDPRRTAVQGNERSRVGTLAPVPRTTTSRNTFSYYALNQ